MDVREAPPTSTLDFRDLDETTTFELYDGSSAVQNRKRRRSSLRRVSFAEQPSIHVFARDDDYETPPEGTTSHLSVQSTPTSVSRSPQRRSRRLAARGGGQDENEIDKENVPVSVGSNARQGRRGRRPLALRDTQKEKEEEFLKPSNWLDDHENSAFGSCDDNTGPVDLRHISFENSKVALEEDDNMTMDSQTFHTRMSQVFAKQPLNRLSEEKLVEVTTPGQLTDMELTTALTQRQALDRERRVLEPPTWHRGSGDSDMSQGSLNEISIFRVLAKKRSTAKESDSHDYEENTMDVGNNWIEDDAQSRGSMSSMKMKKIGSLRDMDDVVSMETSSPQSNRERSKVLRDEHLMAYEGEHAPDTRNSRDSDGSEGSHLQGSRTRERVYLNGRRPSMLLQNRSSRFDNDDTVSMETTSQSHADKNDVAMEIDSGTDERLSIPSKHASDTLEGSVKTASEHTAQEPSAHQSSEHNITLESDHIALKPPVQSGAIDESSVLSKHYEKRLKGLSASTSEKESSVHVDSKMDSQSQSLKSQGHAPSMPEEPRTRQQVYRHAQALERQVSFSSHRAANKESGKSVNLQARDGFVNHGIEQGPLLSLPDENTESMDITKTWNGRVPQHNFVPTRSSDSAKSYFSLVKDQRMDMSDVDITDNYAEGITEAIPKWKDVLGAYNCDSPSIEPLNRILQKKHDVNAEDSPVYVRKAEVDFDEALPAKRDAGLSKATEDRETVLSRDLDDSTVELHLNMGKKRNIFQNPEDTFSFKGHQKSIKETSVSPPMKLNEIPKPMFSNVREKVALIEANQRSQIAPNGSERDFQDDDTTGDFTGQHNWRAEVSSDMSTTPLSPRRPDYFQRLITKPQVAPIATETGLADSPSFIDGITAAIPNVQDLLAADAGTPESELGWNPRKIVWSAQQSNRRTLGDQDDLRQPRPVQMEDDTMDSMPDQLHTPKGLQDKEHKFECMTEEAVKTLNQVSHSKEVRNSVASKMLMRLMSLQDKGRAEAESSSDGESQQILRRTLQFHPESDSQLQSQSLREGDTGQQMSAGDPDDLMKVESIKDMDEETDSIDTKTDSSRQESRMISLLQELQLAEEKLGALKRRSEELRIRAQDCHQAIAKKCRDDSCFEMKELAAFCSQAHVSKLKKRCQLLNCVQWWNVKSTKTGDGQVLHEFKYWSLLTHSIFERKATNLEAIVSRSLIDLNDEKIDQVYSHMNASLAWRWFLSGLDEIIQSQSLFYHVQCINSKVMILLDLMEEVKNCRKYLVIPYFRLQTDKNLHLGLKFSNSELLFDFVVLLNIRQVVQMRYSRRYELDRAVEMSQKLDCDVEMEAEGRFFGKKVTAVEIKNCVSSVVSGHQLLSRVCACVNTLIERIKGESNYR